MTISSVLKKLLEETKEEHEESNESYSKSLLSVLRKNHYWPKLQIKKFYGYPNMILLHNTYIRSDTTEFQELYNECRSVIIDFSQDLDNNIIIYYSNTIPKRISDINYETDIKSDDICEIAYDATMIYVYYHNNKWFFGTTSCPSVDNSKFSHPTKKHGEMLNEALIKLFPDCINNVRDKFIEYLEQDKVYEFALVHYENTKFIDYTQELGPEYKFIFHISTKIKYGEQIQHYNSFANIGIRYVKRFESPIEAIQYIRDIPYDIYGFIVIRDNVKIYKVSKENIIFREDTDHGNPNPWRNMIWVYQQNKLDYGIDDYIKQYTNGIECPINDIGISFTPSYLIDTCMHGIKDVLYNFYLVTTKYFPQYNRFKMSKELDKQLPPMLQFHLAQLRHNQITTHKYTKSMITPVHVFEYLCKSNNVKNILSLINLIATNTTVDFGLSKEVMDCFILLNASIY